VSVWVATSGLRDGQVTVSDMEGKELGKWEKVKMGEGVGGSGRVVYKAVKWEEKGEK